MLPALIVEKVDTIDVGILIDLYIEHAHTMVSMLHVDQVTITMVEVDYTKPCKLYLNAIMSRLRS